MVPLRDSSVETQAPGCDLAQLRAGIGPLPRASPEATSVRPKPELRCGWCHRIITAPAAGHSTHCGHCQRSLTVPSHIRAACDRCGHRQQLRLRELGSQPLCSVCGKPLVVGDVILPPRRHHSSRRHRRPSLSSGYADAAWAVLIVGLALVITLFALTR